MLRYFKEERVEILESIKFNKEIIQTYYSCTFIWDRLEKIKILLIENIEYYKRLKNANSFIKNYKVKEKVYTKPVINKIEREYDNMEQDMKREQFIQEWFNNYLLSYSR